MHQSDCRVNIFSLKSTDPKAASDITGSQTSQGKPPNMILKSSFCCPYFKILTHSMFKPIVLFIHNEPQN